MPISTTGLFQTGGGNQQVRQCPTLKRRREHVDKATGATSNHGASSGRSAGSSSGLCWFSSNRFGRGEPERHGRRASPGAEFGNLQWRQPAGEGWGRGDRAGKRKPHGFRTGDGSFVLERIERSRSFVRSWGCIDVPVGWAPGRSSEGWRLRSEAGDRLQDAG